MRFDFIFIKICYSLEYLVGAPLEGLRALKLPRAPFGRKDLKSREFHVFLNEDMIGTRIMIISVTLCNVMVV